MVNKTGNEIGMPNFNLVNVPYTLIFLFDKLNTFDITQMYQYECFFSQFKMLAGLIT